jgi:phosphoribosyl 1,2-cyclic phosphodiesterase
MKVTLWGTRGSLAAPGPDTARYGGNTSCVQVRGDDGTVLILDAGTGIRSLGTALDSSVRRVDLLLTHLHMDHIQGLGFFRPLHDPRIAVHIWGPASTTMDLRTRLMRYLSPPLFPVHLRDLPCTLQLHEVPNNHFTIGEFTVSAALVCHPGPTVGYRIANNGATLAYLPDHEPALGTKTFPMSRDWTSGYPIAAGVDLLIHDSQYSRGEYADHIGWGHSALDHAFQFAMLAEAKHFVPFHHDPAHTDDDLDRIIREAVAAVHPAFPVSPGTEGVEFSIDSHGRVTKTNGLPRLKE